MRRRRTLTLGITLTLAPALTACGLGAKEELADTISTAYERLEGAGSVQATLAVDIAVVKPDHEVAPGALGITPARVPPLATLVDLRRRTAAVALKEADPASASIIFVGSDVYQRIPPKQASSSSAPPGGSPTNLVALGAVDSPPAAVATTTTVKQSALQRAPRIPRQWIAFDYASLDEKDTTRRAGSFAINPAVLLGLTTGVLTGSIERRQDGVLTRFEANVNRDKADRRLEEDEQELLDKIFKANAISGRTFPARIWIDANGDLRRFEVRMRQHVTNVDRADMTVTIEVTESGTTSSIAPPDAKATARVGSLGQLVTAVAR